MVLAGTGPSLEIKGTLDTTLIQRGFSTIKSGFIRMKGVTEGFSSDLERMSVAAGNLARRLGKIALVGVGTMTALAKSSPAVAPAMAKMGVAFQKLSRNLGEALAPAFEKVAGWLDKLATWVGENKGAIGELATRFLKWGEAVGTTLWPWIKKIGDWVLGHPKLFAGILAGLVLSPAIKTGIGLISGLVTLMTGAKVSASLLAVLGAIVAAARGLAEIVGGINVDEQRNAQRVAFLFQIKDFFTGGNEYEQFLDVLRIRQATGNRRTELLNSYNEVYG